MTQSAIISEVLSGGTANLIAWPYPRIVAGAGRLDAYRDCQGPKDRLN